MDNDHKRIEPSPEEVLGQRVVSIGHSNYSEPEVIVEGLGSAMFRLHIITLSSGLVLDLFTAEITKSDAAKAEMPGETVGLPIESVIGRTVTGLLWDHCHSALMILDHDYFLNDANDAVNSNPLFAGRLEEHYTAEEQAQFIDYWTELPLAPRRSFE